MALSLAIPMSMILDTLLDNDACSLALLVAGAFMGWWVVASCMAEKNGDMILYDPVGDIDGT